MEEKAKRLEVVPPPESEEPVKAAAPEEPKVAAPETSEDTSDIEALFTDQAHGDALTETTRYSIPVGKPKDFFRVPPDKAYRRRAEIYEHKPENAMESTFYIMDPKMRGRLPEAQPGILVVCVYRDGGLRVWPIKLPRPDGKDFVAWSTARDVARAATVKWVKPVWTGKEGYTTRDAQPGYAGEPNWKKLPPFNSLVKAAFGSHGVIKDDKHPVFRNVIGAAPTSGDDDGGDDDGALDL